MLSFFTGAGFLDLGFEDAGFTSVWHNEYSEDFRRGFAFGTRSMGKGRGREIENPDSIVDVGPDRIIREAFEMHVPPIFGMIGGPPCPDFSSGGKNKGHEGENGRLSGVYVERIMEIRPTFFIFENVPGLFRTAKHKEFFASLVDKLKPHYFLDWNILNALEYGVPQDRQRVIFFGLSQSWVGQSDLFSQRFLDKSMHERMIAMRLRNVGLPGVHWFPWAKGRIHPDAKKAIPWPDVAPFGMDIPMPAGIPEQLTVWGWIKDLVEGATTPNQSDQFRAYSPKFNQIPEGFTAKKSFKRLHRWRFSPAAAYGNNEVHLHPTLPRRLSVREALRIQTVPDNYQLPPDMPLSKKFKTIGNGVPFLLAKAVALGVRRVLTEGISDADIRPDSRP